MLQAQGIAINDEDLESNAINPTWVKKTDLLHDSNKLFINNNLDSHKGLEGKGTNYSQQTSDYDQGIVTNIGKPRQSASIFFNPYWTTQTKNSIYHDNNGFIYQPNKNAFHNQPGINGVKNLPVQSGIYAASKGNIVQLGKGNSQKPQYVGNKDSDYVRNKNHGHTTLLGSKGYKQGNNLQKGDTFYSLSRDALNSTNPSGKKVVPYYKLRNSPYNSIHQSNTQNLGRSGSFPVQVKVINKEPFKKNKYGNKKAFPLNNRIRTKYSQGKGPIKKQQGNQEITNELPGILRNTLTPVVLKKIMMQKNLEMPKFVSTPTDTSVVQTKVIMK